MPDVQSYNVDIQVQDTGEFIKVNMDDWYPLEEIWGKLKDAYNASTVAELVRNINNNPQAQLACDNIINCEISKESNLEAHVLVNRSQKI